MKDGFFCMYFEKDMHLKVMLFFTYLMSISTNIVKKACLVCFRTHAYFLNERDMYSFEFQSIWASCIVPNKCLRIVRFQLKKYFLYSLYSTSCLCENSLKVLYYLKIYGNYFKYQNNYVFSKMVFYFLFVWIYMYYVLIYAHK